MNDERPIEKLLRRFAKKRRDEAGAPAELHPANRRLLQAEVARQFPKAQRREGWWAGLSLLLNRKLTYAVAIVAVVGVSILLMLPTKKNEMGLVALESRKSPLSELPASSTVVAAEELKPAADLEVRTGFADANAAKDSFAKRSEPLALAERNDVTAETLDESPKQASPPTLTLAPAAAPVSVDTQRERAGARQQQVAESIAKFNEQDVKAASGKLDLPVNYPTESAKPAGAPTLATASPATNATPQELFARRFGLAPAPAAARTAARTPVKAEAAPTGLAGSAQDYREKLVQSFSQVSVNGQVTSGRKTGGAITPVLASFTVEQTGDQIRVTDSDGSTYTGLVQFASQESTTQKEFIARGGGLEKSRQSQTSYNAVATDAKLADALNNQNLFFKVSGTNRTLKQQVNFVGNFVVFSNQSLNPYNAPQFADKAKNSANQQNLAPLLQNSAIRGRLQIGSNRETEFNAVPVKQ